MKNRIGRATKGGILMLALAMFLVGCQDDLIPKKLSSKQQAELAAQDHAQMMIATQEVLDVTAGALEDKGVAEGRVKHSDHDNFGQSYAQRRP